MRLTLAIHDIGSITLGAATKLEGNKMVVDPVELRQLLLEDSRLQSVDIETVSPGEECRIGVVYDIIEPRAKEPGSGSDFPGILGPIEMAAKEPLMFCAAQQLRLLMMAPPWRTPKYSR